MEIGDGGFPFAVVSDMLKREDYKQTRHDSIFTQWQVLIGSNDWEDFKKGKDGVTRYRIQNLPRKSCPGLYELGVSIMNHEQGRQVDSIDVLVAYLGQAESVRSRLQKYGRSAAHLRNVNLTSDNHYCEKTHESIGSKTVTSGLFEDIFSKGGSIVYRWAPMRSKKDAEVKEILLLGTFDYAWNKGSNGERRHYDLLKKLGDNEFMSKRRTSSFWMNLFSFNQKQIGVKIKGEKHVLAEEKRLNGDSDKEKSYFFSGIRKFSRFRPQSVSDSDRFGNVDTSDSGSVCGVILIDGSSCTRPPVKGRKRCTDHKGERICRVSPKPSPEKQKLCEVSPEKHKLYEVSPEKQKLYEISPVENHQESAKPSPEKQKLYEVSPEKQKVYEVSPEKQKLYAVSPEKQKLYEVSPVENHQESDITCGVILIDGETCRNRSVSGRKRCEDHKGMRINGYLFLLNKSEKKSSAGKWSDVKQESTSLFCEAITKSGSPCTRSPSKGSRKCWQHKERTSNDDISPGNISPVRVNHGVCGVKLYDASVCQKSPVKGRKRCELHKGMRISITA